MPWANNYESHQWRQPLSTKRHYKGSSFMLASIRSQCLHLRFAVVIRLLYLNGHLYLVGVGLSENQRTNITKDTYVKEIGLHVQISLLLHAQQWPQLGESLCSINISTNMQFWNHNEIKGSVIYVMRHRSFVNATLEVSVIIRSWRTRKNKPKNTQLPHLFDRNQL